jgi:thiamine-phosphate pyrophosphorylase
MRVQTPLPAVFLITPEPPGQQHEQTFLESLSNSLATGVKLVQLRAKEMDESSYADLACKVLQVCRRHGAQLILNGPVPDPQHIDADGLHLTSAQLKACSGRPVASGKLLPAACHTPEELLHAERIGVDFVTLSPVLATRSHPEAEPVGWERFEQLARAVSIPVFALGGMTRADVPLAKARGAHGVAAIHALWQE